MKSRLIALLVISSLILVGYVSYAYRYRVAAKIWHWKHGYSASMGNYVVPVPEHWLILDENSVAFTLVNTSSKRPKQDGKFRTAAVINFFPRANLIVEPSRVDVWLSLRKQQLANEQIDPIELKTLRFGSESIICIGGGELDALAKNSKARERTPSRLPACRSAALKFCSSVNPLTCNLSMLFYRRFDQKTKVGGEVPVSAPGRN